MLHRFDEMEIEFQKLTMVAWNKKYKMKVNKVLTVIGETIKLCWISVDVNGLIWKIADWTENSEFQALPDANDYRSWFMFKLNLN